MRRILPCIVLLASTGFVTLSVKTDLVCSLTGKHIGSCCCQEKNGKLHCTLADKDIEDCCCK